MIYKGRQYAKCETLSSQYNVCEHCAFQDSQICPTTPISDSGTARLLCSIEGDGVFWMEVNHDLQRQAVC